MTWLTISSVDDLLQAGVLDAETIVVTDQLQSMEGIYQDEEYMADAYTIVGVQTIYRYSIISSTCEIFIITY